MSRRLGITLAVLLLIATGLLAWWFARAPAVPAVKARIAPLVRTLQFSGRVATLSRVDIGSTLTGRVRQVVVIEGARVSQGDVLVRLESDELRAALEQAQASESQARARLAGLRSTGRSATRSAQSQADSVLIAARSELRRTQELVKKGFISQARLDEVQRSVSVAEAQQVGARAQSAAVSERGTEIAQALAQVALAEAATSSAQARLAQTELVAPVNARVLSRLVEPGQIVQPGRALMSLALAGPLLLVAQVDERYLEQLQTGQAVAVLADAFPDQRFAAHVRSIAPLVDTQRGAIEVKFSVDQEPPAFLREDMTLSLEVETARRERALVVPVSALRANSSELLIASNGRVEPRKVRIGLRTLELAEVLDGLQADELVLIGSTPKIGSRVRADPSAILPGPSSRATREDAGSAMSNAMGR